MKITVTPTGQPMTGPLGQGGGMGLDMGGGRGMGRGMGGGGGMGRGMGRGLGITMGGGFGMSNWPAVGQVASPSESEPDPEQAKSFLREQVRILEGQKRQIEQRISELETGYRSVAVVVPDKLYRLRYLCRCMSGRCY